MKIGKYDYCPKCGWPGKLRERRPNGNDICANGHVYPSGTAVSREHAKKIKSENK